MGNNQQREYHLEPNKKGQILGMQNREHSYTVIECILFYLYYSTFAFNLMPMRK